jgi:hypothetical protein
MVAGTCASNGNGGCTLDGELCPGCNTCCSRVCAPTPTGSSVCQPAGGCRLLGDLCHVDSDCCGGPQTNQSMCSIGEVVCMPVAGTNPPVGQCSNPGPGTSCVGGGTCNPEGDVCGIKPVQACSGSAREDCCDCITPKYNCCKFDSHGVARCFGGSTPTCPNGYTGQPPCCITFGNTCTFSDECCNHLPCVPDNNGVLRCQEHCQTQGLICTATSDCCLGLVCVIPSGQLTGMCEPVTPPPPPDMAMPPPDMAMPPLDLSVPPVDMAMPPHDLSGQVFDLRPPPPDLTKPPPDLTAPRDLTPPPRDLRPPPPPDLLPPPDLTQPPPCSQLGQPCSSTQPCCPPLPGQLGLACAPPGGIGLCAPGETDCTCVGIIP